MKPKKYKKKEKKSKHALTYNTPRQKTNKHFFFKKKIHSLSSPCRQKPFAPRLLPSGITGTLRELGVDDGVNEHGLGETIV